MLILMEVFLMSLFSVALCTCDNIETAHKIAKSVVQQKLAACVNILPTVQSVYTWNDQIEQSEEVMMILKTSSSLVEKLKLAVISLHSYDVPEFICLDITHGHQPYLDWLSTSTQKG